MRALTSIASAISISVSSFVAVAHAQTGPVHNWTGFYLGTHIGAAAAGNGWHSEDLGVLPRPFPDSFTSGGVLSGLQFGYNYQAGNWVFGVEADASFADIEGGALCARAIYVCTTHIDALGTFGLRAGYAFGDLLLYGKAGGGWLHERFDATPSPSYGTTAIFQGKATRVGLMLGAGVEYAFYRNLSARLEYNYLDFDNGTLSATSQTGDHADFGVRQQLHLVKLGLNYKLGETSPLSGWPPSAGGVSGHDWTGVFVGAHAGGSWGTTDWKSSDGPLAAVSTSSFPGSGTMDGMIGGVQAGYNKQFGSIVAGLEADVSWANLDGFAKCATTEAPPEGFICHSHIDMLGTVTGRLGFTYDNLLVYGRAGFAWAHEKHDARQDPDNVVAGSATRTGYAVGSGLEYAFNSAWSGRFEYRYLDFGTRTLPLVTQSGYVSNVALAQRNHVVMVALNYRLGADAGTTAMAAGFPAKAPPVFSDWEMEVGTRLWYSNGKIQKDLYDNLNNQIVNSRLIYGDMTGPSLEGFARFDHRSGLFVKANFGMGALIDGRLHDEDQPPGTVPYSNTSHPMKDGSLRYGSADVGFNLLATPAGKIGPFVGYRYFYQLGRGFGCTQIGPGAACIPVPESMVGLSETEQWRGLAVGLNSKLALSNRMSLELDAAWVPIADRASVDNHWLRADINPAPANGRAWGVQVEGVLNYALTPRWSVGVGGRYWSFATTNGSTRFPGTAETSPLKFTSHRYGAFVQTSYKFGGTTGAALPENLPPADWNGIYAGLHLGAGFGRNTWADPYPTPPTGDYTMMGGALSGLQLGVNKQFGQWVVGAEVAGSLALLEGSNTCFGGDPNLLVTAQECENRTNGIGLLTARLGYAFGRSLVYARAGGALARDVYVLNSGAAGGSIDTQRHWNAGWTVGGGIEHALTDRWSVNAEYKYLDFGSRTVHFNVPAAISDVADTSIRNQRQTLTLGVNYKFGEP